MTWRMAESLQVLLKQLNTLAPERNKDSDGGIGDANHSARTSDHNPDDDGVVKARDFTHDPAHGVDSQKLAEQLVASRDSRIKYIISNRRIISGEAGPQPWVWRPYTGKNPHNHHVHVSVRANKAYYDSPGLWKISLVVPTEIQAVQPPKIIRPTLRLGDSGEPVGQLQVALNKAGASLSIDRKFGPATKAAVQSFQRKRGLVSDGVVGKYTWDALDG